MPTIYATFIDPSNAEKAAGALLDHGARSEDLSILANEKWNTVSETGEMADTEHSAKTGISTTTGADAALGAVKGTALGVGLGALGALAAITIPGLGIIIGGGAMAAAFGATMGAAAAGAVAGGVVGYLKDQGMGEEVVTQFTETINAGGALLSLNIPSGKIEGPEAEQFLSKYGATRISTAGGETPIMERATMVESHGGTAVIAGGEIYQSDDVRVDPVSIEPLTDDPVTGAMVDGIAINEVTGTTRPVHRENGEIVYSDEPKRG